MANSIFFYYQSGDIKNCGTVFGGNSRFGTNGISIVRPGCSLGTFTWRYSGVPRLPKSIVIAICRFCHCHLSGLWTSILLNDVPGRRDTQSSGKAIQTKRFLCISVLVSNERNICRILSGSCHFNGASNDKFSVECLFWFFQQTLTLVQMAKNDLF